MSFDHEAFCSRIRRLMAGETLQQFAKGCGLSRTNLTRLLGDGNDSPPRKSTLKKIAEYTGADYEDLLSVCGYPLPGAKAQAEPSLDERAARNAEGLEKGFVKLIGKPRLLSGPGELLDEAVRLYGTERCDASLGDPFEYNGNLHEASAEYCVIGNVSVRDATGASCTTYFALYYADTKGGNCIVTDYAFDGSSLVEAGIDFRETLPADYTYETVCRMDRVTVTGQADEFDGAFRRESDRIIKEAIRRYLAREDKKDV